MGQDPGQPAGPGGGATGSPRASRRAHAFLADWPGPTAPSHHARVRLEVHSPGAEPGSPEKQEAAVPELGGGLHQTGQEPTAAGWSSSGRLEFRVRSVWSPHWCKGGVGGAWISVLTGSGASTPTGCVGTGASASHRHGQMERRPPDKTQLSSRSAAGKSGKQ